MLWALSKQDKKQRNTHCYLIEGTFIMIQILYFGLSPACFFFKVYGNKK